MTSADRPNVVQHVLSDKPSLRLGGEARWDVLPETLEATRMAVRDSDSTFGLAWVAQQLFPRLSPPTIQPSALIRLSTNEFGLTAGRLVSMTVPTFCRQAVRRCLGSPAKQGVYATRGPHRSRTLLPLPVIDWYCVSCVLKVGGKLLMIDVPVPVVGQMAFRHMRLKPNWRLDRVCDDRSGSFTLVAVPGPEDDWVHQPFNNNYSDYSFVALPERLGLQTTFRPGQLRRVVSKWYSGCTTYTRGRCDRMRLSTSGSSISSTYTSLIPYDVVNDQAYRLGQDRRGWGGHHDNVTQCGS